MDQIKIAVIGLGPAGLAALKCLREEGFDAVGLERRDKVGGLWAWSDNPKYTSVLQKTIINLSKFVSAFSDFPIPKDYPIFPDGRQIAAYFQSYARHFNLEEHIRFHTSVQLVTRNEAENKWNVQVTGPNGDEVLVFDKVVFGHGPHTVPKLPLMPGRELFTGTVIHGQKYRGPEEFAGKRVMVVGIGNSGCEVAINLSRHASKLYHSYRRGRLMTSRYLDDGVCFDSTLTWSGSRTKHLLDYHVPWLTTPIVDNFVMNKMISDAARSEPDEPGVTQKEKIKRAEKKVKEDWHLTPPLSMSLANPNGQENWFPAVYEGRITPVRAFKGFSGPNLVKLADDSEVEVDAVIFCTGYSHQFDIIPELEMDGACGLPLKTAGETAAETIEKPGAVDKEVVDASKPPHLPRLFHLIFPPKYASSVAFMNFMAPQENAWCVSELSSMAVAQIWAAEEAKNQKQTQPPPAGYRTPALLPTIAEMNAQVDSYHTWWRQLWTTDHSALQGFVQGHTFYRYLHEKAGTGMYDHVDHMFSTRGLKLWWSDRELHAWLSKGPMNAYSWRLFDTNPQGIPGCGRKTWPEARKAVKDANDLLDQYRKDMMNEELRKKEMIWENDS